MLSYTRLIRSRIASGAFNGSLRASASSINGSISVRSQHTDSPSQQHPLTKSRFDENGSFRAGALGVNDFEDARGNGKERRGGFIPKEQFNKLRAEKIQELTKIAKKAEAEVETTENVEELFSGMLNEVEAYEVRFRASFEVRKAFEGIITKFLDRAIEGTNPNFTIDEVLEKTASLSILNIYHFDKAAKHKFQSGQLDEVLQLWVSFLEYITTENIKAGAVALRQITTLTYFESCAKAGGAPNLDDLKALLQVEEISVPRQLVYRLNLLMNRKDPRYRQIRMVVNKVGYANSSPNSLQVLNRASEAANKGEGFTVDNILGEMRQISEASGKEISEDSLVAFMGFYNKTNQATRAMGIWNELIKSGITPSIEAWNALLETVSKIGPFPQRIDQVESILSKIKNKNDETYATLIKVYASLKEEEKISEFVKQDDRLSKPVIAQAYIQYLSSRKRIEEADKIFNKLPSGSANIVTYNALLTGNIRSGKFSQASEILNKMSKANIKPDIATYSMIIDLTFKNARARGEIVNDFMVKEFLDNMRKAGIEPNSYTLTSIIDGLGKDASHTETSIKLFQYLKEQNLATLVTYVSMISSMFNLGNVRQAELYIGDFLEAGHSMTLPLWNMIFEGLMKNRRGDLGKKYYDTFRVTGPDGSYPKVNRFTLYFIIRMARNERDVDFANLILQDIDKTDNTGNISRTTISICNDLASLPNIEMPESVSNLLKSSS